MGINIDEFITYPSIYEFNNSETSACIIKPSNDIPSKE